jgi:ABC-2 type transport system permease protein
MSGMRAFLGKELHETYMTWRLWVLPGILVFLGITTPILAAATPKILELSARSMPGAVVKLPPPMARDSYLQFIGNLDQMVLIALVITGAALIAGERKSGTMVLMLTKPLSRAGFVIAKIVAQSGLVAVATAIGTGLCIALTVAIFDTGEIVPFLAGVALWLVFAVMMTALMALLSAWFGGQAAAAGAGIGAYVLFLVLSGFPITRDVTPAGLTAAYGPLLKHESVALFWPLVTTIVLTIVFAASAVGVFSRKEI